MKGMETAENKNLDKIAGSLVRDRTVEVSKSEDMNV